MMAPIAIPVVAVAAMPITTAPIATMQITTVPIAAMPVATAQVTSTPTLAAPRAHSGPTMHRRETLAATAPKATTAARSSCD
jgi:hypothetical protein